MDGVVALRFSRGELSQVLVASVRECAHALYTPAAHMLH